LVSAFEQVKDCYPEEQIGNDDENALDAFEQALKYVDLAGLIAGANEIKQAASRGEQVPELIEFLVSKVGFHKDTRN
jgi:hypothetical protein